MRKPKRKLVLVSQRLRPLLGEATLARVHGAGSSLMPPCTFWETGCKSNNSEPNRINGIDGIDQGGMEP